MTGDIENQITIFFSKASYLIFSKLTNNSVVLKNIFLRKSQINIFHQFLFKAGTARILDAPATADKLTIYVVN